MDTIAKLTVLTEADVVNIKEEFGTPAYVYSAEGLRARAKDVLAFPNAFGLTVRFAMKSCPNREILNIFRECGIQIDASSVHEVRRALLAGFEHEKISLSTQEFPSHLDDLVSKGLKINLCSLGQIEKYGRQFPNTAVGLRFNPGLGSGGTERTNVGGSASSFGIWHEYVPQVKELVKEFNLEVTRIHTHIGSGSDPAVWNHVSSLTLNIVREFPSVTACNLGGGYKVARVPEEKSTDIQVVGAPVKTAFESFAQETGRKLHLEIEPGTFLTANNGFLVATVQDIVDTGASGHTFIKLDAGMTEVLRPSLYGAQHPIVIVPYNRPASEEAKEYIVVGHCCESGDILTPAPGDGEKLKDRLLQRAHIGDLCVIGGCGAYCSAMSTKHYNSYPAAPEVLLQGGQLFCIRKRETLDDVIRCEVPLPR